MGQIIFLILAGCALVFALFWLEAYRAKRDRKRFVRQLYEDSQKLAKKEYAPERFARIGSYFLRHPSPEQLDEITWNDLGMDELFKRMNYTLSATGEEYLYYTLRTPRRDEEELLHLEDLVQYFANCPDDRVKVQVQLHRLGYTGRFSLYDYRYLF